MVTRVQVSSSNQLSFEAGNRTTVYFVSLHQHVQPFTNAETPITEKHQSTKGASRTEFQCPVIFQTNGRQRHYCMLPSRWRRGLRSAGVPYARKSASTRGSVFSSSPGNVRSAVSIVSARQRCATNQKNTQIHRWYLPASLPPLQDQRRRPPR